MPIKRTYGCPDCNHRIEVTLALEDWQQGPPECPVCAAHAMQQQFKPVAITGSPAQRAGDLALDIAHNDYHVADISMHSEEGATPKVRYKDWTPQATSAAAASSWGVNSQALQTAMAYGRQNRQQFGDGLDVLKSNLNSGAQPDLIEVSKRRAMKIW